MIKYVRGQRGQKNYVMGYDSDHMTDEEAMKALESHMADEAKSSLRKLTQLPVGQVVEPFILK